jgi:hypothetical protein
MRLLAQHTLKTRTDLRGGRTAAGLSVVAVMPKTGTTGVRFGPEGNEPLDVRWDPDVPPIPRTRPLRM